MVSTFISTNFSPDDFQGFIRLALAEELPPLLHSLTKQPSTPKYLSRTEAAARLKISKTTLTEKVKKGEIVAHRFGDRRILFKEEDICNALEKIEVKAKGGAAA